MAEQNPGSQTLVQRLVALIGHSAEYSIAFALLAVCLIVGVAIWLLQPSAPQVTPQNNPSQSTSARAAEAKGADEQAALGAWKQKLEGGFDQMDQKQRRAEDERARQEQQRQEEEFSAKAKRKAQQAAAEIPAATTRAIEATPPVSFTPKPTIRPAPVRVDAAIDWSSCKRPVYPDLSMRKNEQGAVTVDIDLDDNARVLRSRISQSSGFERLDVAAQKAIEKCRFHSATVDGLPQASTAVVRFTWALQGGK